MSWLGTFFHTEISAEDGEGDRQSAEQEGDSEGEAFRFAKKNREKPEKYGKQNAADRSVKQGLRSTLLRGNPSADKSGHIKSDQPHRGDQAVGIIDSTANCRTQKKKCCGGAQCGSRAEGGFLQKHGKGSVARSTSMVRASRFRLFVSLFHCNRTPCDSLCFYVYGKESVNMTVFFIHIKLTKQKNVFLEKKTKIW